MGSTGYASFMTHSTIDVDRLYQQIGKTIHDLRLAKNPRLTQAGLAELLGVTRTSITNIEKGKQRIPLHLLYTLCAKLSVQISDVIPVVEDVVGQLPETTSRKPDQSTRMPPKTAALIRNLSMGENE
jgi:DNA-binding XRE family transcriptional regulator